MSDSLRSHGLQHARLPCPSPTPGACSNLNVHGVSDAIQPPHPLSSLLLQPSIFLYLQSFRVFSNESLLRITWTKYWYFSFSIRTSMNIQGWFPLGLTSLISMQPKELSRVSSNTTVQKHQFFSVQLYHTTLTSTRDYWKNYSFRQTFVCKVMSLLFNMLSRLVIAFLPRSKHLLISWLQSPSAVILEPKIIKSLTVSIVSPSICHEVMALDAMIFIFECWVLSQLFHSPLSLSSRGSSVTLHFLP